MHKVTGQAGGHPIMACFAFAPSRQAIILCAGDKRGWDENHFYKKLIKTADDEYKVHLADMGG
nr:type II toxin-antitoxin system RelE/ParE family toxin [Trabulsiella odontotermitis]